MAKARQKIFQSIGYRSRGRLIWIIFGICIYAICQEANEMQQSKDREDLKAECIMYSLAIIIDSIKIIKQLASPI